MRGRALSLSAPRRLVIDLMRFSVAVPRVTVQRRMNLGPVLKARSAATQRASWTAIFLRGYSLVALENPEFRRAYLKCPWPQLYEYPSNVASIAHERELNGERAVLLVRIKSPEKRSIAELDAMIAKARSKPVFEIGDFRRSLRFAGLPAPLRWLLMWLGLNLARQRAIYFGTFQLSVYSGLGAKSLNPLTPLTTLLNYGRIDLDGSVDVQIHYDHRVMDGANVARALERFEAIMNGVVADELKQFALKPPSAAQRKWPDWHETE